MVEVLESHPGKTVYRADPENVDVDQLHADIAVAQSEIERLVQRIADLEAERAQLQTAVAEATAEIQLLRGV